MPPQTVCHTSALHRVKVLLPMPFDAPFDYAAADPKPAPGTIVRVPLGKHLRVAVLWDDDEKPVAGKKPVADKRLKPVDSVLDAPPMSGKMRHFIAWVAHYTLSPLGAVLRMALPAQVVDAAAPTQTVCVLAGDPPAKLTKARRKVLDAAQRLGPSTVASLAKAADVSDGVVRGLVKSKTLSTREISRDKPYDQPDPDRQGPDLREEQQIAATQLRAAVLKAAFAPILLEGVTGSGKTEVYFEAVAQALRHEGGQVLVMLPEIALTSQWLDRFEARFGARPVEWHSDLSPAERRRAWHGVASGSARIVVGARSALFLPFRDLRLLVVDEEHDPSFKQEEGVLYNARDMAVVRARFEACPIVLSTATPALETLLNARDGRYGHLVLAARHGAAQLPTISAIDLRSTPPETGDWLAPPLAEAISQTLAEGEQVLLFLNRRGYAPLTLCRTCGVRLECPHCTAWLVEHRYKRQVQCHHCGFSMPADPDCASCGGTDSMVACGPGVERVAEEVMRRWPQARLDVMTSDTITSPAKTRELVARIEAGAADIIVGTQIITKGYHFPKLTLVGVVDADLGLRGGDLRAGERCWQQMVQVAGRAGRAERAGHVFLQTYDPSHPVTRALIEGDREAFLTREIEERERAGMPPFGRLAGVILSGPDLDAVSAAGKALARAAPMQPGISVYGPAPAPLARLRGQHRHRLLIQTARKQPIQTIVQTWISQVKLPSSVRLRIDVDPYSFL
ncbi:primosomal protein N' [Iodidimonas muriae]|nr:primosomal protein N' [Iodidimonas muriae]